MHHNTMHENDMHTHAHMQGVEQVARNVCRVLTLCGRSELHVYAGCAEPLVSARPEPNYWFGRDGLGDASHVSQQNRSAALTSRLCELF